MRLSWDRKGFFIDGKPGYLVSGEFHYFRVPKEDWARRMRLFKQAGGNTLATYVPWLIHEPEEGHILFGDRPERDLAAFLETAAAEGLMVILRPGPYQYSELMNDGLPAWLLDDYPEVLARRADGSPFRRASISYLHPVFLEKARKYFAAFAEVARPYMASRGGPVVMLQLDNELAGIHTWFGTLDYNRETMGIGRDPGRWPAWLARKYGDVASMNDACDTAYAAFSEVIPTDTPANPAEELVTRDYADFYAGTMAEYLMLLASWLREDGLDGPLCHNSGSLEMDSMHLESVAAQGKDFLLGTDHYYNLEPTYPQNHPTPQFLLRCLYSLDQLRAMGMPPTVLEMPGGNIVDVPPILPGDLYADYMMHTAFGMKGVNYYIYTGGPNFPGTGNTCDLYDYNAPVSAEGEVRPTYEALARYGAFVRENAWLSRSDRVTSVQLGFCWKDTRFPSAMYRGHFTGNDAWNFATFGLSFAYALSSTPAEFVPVTGDLDPAKPLVLSCPERMSRREQERVLDFIREGGSAVLMPILPTMDEYSRPCAVLAEGLGLGNIRPFEPREAFVTVLGEHIYRTRGLHTADLPEGAEVLAEAEDSPVGALLRAGRGRAVWLGFTYGFAMFSHVRMMERVALLLGAKRVAESSEPNILTVTRSDGRRRMLFAANLYTCPMETELFIYEGEEKRSLGRRTLAPMEVVTLDPDAGGEKNRNGNIL